MCFRTLTDLCCSPVIHARRKRKSKRRTFGLKDTPVCCRSTKKNICWLIHPPNLNLCKWDFGTITILYSQPIAALQILTKDGHWKWVKHLENALVGINPFIFSNPPPFSFGPIFFVESKWQVINAGDALEFLSGGFYRATIHRYCPPLFFLLEHLL